MALQDQTPSVQPSPLGQILGTPTAGVRPGPPATEEERQQRVQGWKAFLQHPETRAALLQFAVMAGQPVPIGQTPFGQFQQSIAGGLQAAGTVRSKAEEEAARQQELANQRVVSQAAQTRAQAAQAQAAAAQEQAAASTTRAQTAKEKLGVDSRLKEQELELMRLDAQIRQEQNALEKKKLQAQREANASLAAYREALAGQAKSETERKQIETLLELADTAAGPAPDPLDYKDPEEYTKAVVQRSRRFAALVDSLASQAGVQVPRVDYADVAKRLQELNKRLQATQGGNIGEKKPPEKGKKPKEKEKKKPKGKDFSEFFRHGRVNG